MPANSRWDLIRRLRVKTCREKYELWNSTWIWAVSLMTWNLPRMGTGLRYPHWIRVWVGNWLLLDALENKKKTLGPTANRTPIPWSGTSWSTDYTNISHKRPKTTCKVGKFRQHSLYNVIYCSRSFKLSLLFTIFLEQVGFSKKTPCFSWKHKISVGNGAFYWLRKERRRVEKFTQYIGQLYTLSYINTYL